MNRIVDYRADYYSLGASLYELLTGTPPFRGESPLELIHAHMAVLPDAPESRVKPWSTSPPAFEAISPILFKLLAKSPEDRYQTAPALQANQRACLSLLQEPVEAQTKKPRFQPGQFDRPTELNFPQMLISRQEETEALNQAFRRTLRGPKEMVLVSGEAGVGKTALVSQLIRPATEHKGLFLYAKADQARRLEVYPLLVDLLDEFCRLIVSEPESSFKKWRERIQLAVVPHGHLLTDLCPRLEIIIGPQPPVDPVDTPRVSLRWIPSSGRLAYVVCPVRHERAWTRRQKIAHD